MKKIIIIDECYQCPHSFAFKQNSNLECDKKERTIPNPYKIPKWCPLPDAPLSYLSSRPDNAKAMSERLLQHQQSCVNHIDIELKKSGG